MRIKNKQAVLDKYGAKDEAHMSNKVYKYTRADGARFETHDVPTKKVVQTWTATLSRGITGVVIIGARRKGGKRMPADKLPKHVQEYLLMEKGNKSGLPIEEYDSLKAGDEITRVTKVGPLKRIVTFRIEHQLTKREDGLMVFASTESGEAVQEFLAFPFDAEALDQAIENVADASDEADGRFSNEEDE